MWLSKWNGVALISMTAMIFCGSLLWDNQLHGQPRQVTDGQRTTPPLATQVANNKLIRRDSQDLVVPAPKEQKAAAGRRKALVYALDENGGRIPAQPTGDSAKEVIIDLRWAVVVGVVDHRAIQTLLSQRRNSQRITARDLYRRVDLERKSLSPAGSWSDWQPVDFEPTMRILDNMPEEDEEMTPSEFRPSTLVDPLPFAMGERWENVDIKRLIPVEWKTQVERPEDNEGMVRLWQGRRGIVQQTRRPEQPLLMLRAFDFSVEPGRIYQYRARVVILDTRGRGKEVAGTWSEPTEPVAVP